jgi:hypothetical protein
MESRAARGQAPVEVRLRQGQGKAGNRRLVQSHEVTGQATPRRVGIPLNWPARWRSHGAPADCYSADNSARCCCACRNIIHLQCARAGRVCRTAAIRRPGVAGFFECIGRFRKYHPRRAQAHECCTARLRRTSLRDHGAVQHHCLVPRQRGVCVSLEAAPYLRNP